MEFGNGRLIIDEILGSWSGNFFLQKLIFRDPEIKGNPFFRRKFWNDFQLKSTAWIRLLKEPRIVVGVISNNRCKVLCKMCYDYFKLNSLPRSLTTFNYRSAQMVILGLERFYILGSLQKRYCTTLQPPIFPQKRKASFRARTERRYLVVCLVPANGKMYGCGHKPIFPQNHSEVVGGKITNENDQLT